jgi:hypothetical protein
MIREAQIKRVEVDIGSLGDGDYRFRTSQRWDVSGLETRLVGIVIKKMGKVTARTRWSSRILEEVNCRIHCRRQVISSFMSSILFLSDAGVVSYLQLRSLFCSFFSVSFFTSFLGARVEFR